MVTDPDPEAERVESLLQRQLEGNASEAETEELALYASDRPDLRAHIEQQVARGSLGRGWLERVRKDDAIATLDRGRRAKLERGAGLAIWLGGWVLTYLTPLGYGISALGLLLVLYSVLRVRLATHSNDPYKDVVR
ncbi:MAG: hypothetical protein AAF721_04820 [Myxococcota bacterium]